MPETLKRKVDEQIEELYSFGSRNVAATFQQSISEAIQDYAEFLFAYVEDLAISSDSEEHVEHLQRIFQRINMITLFRKLKKKVTWQSLRWNTLIFSGICKHGQDPERIWWVSSLETPKTRKNYVVLWGFETIRCNTKNPDKVLDEITLWHFFQPFFKD